MQAELPTLIFVAEPALWAEDKGSGEAYVNRQTVVGLVNNYQFYLDRHDKLYDREQSRIKGYRNRMVGLCILQMSLLTIQMLVYDNPAMLVITAVLAGASGGIALTAEMLARALVIRKHFREAEKASDRRTTLY